MGEAETLNVLVVDDHSAMRELLGEIVLREGHQAITAESSEAALELLPVWTFHVAFLDHELPGLEGLLLGEYLRKSNPDMLVALVTGSDDPDLPARTKALDVTFIPKPFDNAAIRRVLDEFYQHAEERAERRARREDPDFAVPFARFADEVEERYGTPSLPDRVVDRLTKTLARSLNELRSKSRYNEQDRAVAYAGLVAARVLGLSLPKVGDGVSMYDEYDRLMERHGRALAFRREDDPEDRG